MTELGEIKQRSFVPSGVSAWRPFIMLFLVVSGPAVRLRTV